MPGHGEGNFTNGMRSTEEDGLLGLLIPKKEPYKGPFLRDYRVE